MSDTSASLLERLGDRADSEAWQRLIILYTPLIRGWVSRHGIRPPDADDLVQEVLGVVVRELPRFRHNGRVGAFRAWLRAISANCLRRSLRTRRLAPDAAGGSDFARFLDQLEDPDGELGRLLDREHDRHIARRLLEWVEPEFQPTTWRAFRRLVLEGDAASAVAADLGLSINAVLIAKSRVLQRLRLMGLGLIDD